MDNINEYAGGSLFRDGRLHADPFRWVYALMHSDEALQSHNFEQSVAAHNTGDWHTWDRASQEYVRAFNSAHNSVSDYTLASGGANIANLTPEIRQQLANQHIMRAPWESVQQSIDLANNTEVGMIAANNWVPPSRDIDPTEYITQYFDTYGHVPELADHTLIGMVKANRWMPPVSDTYTWSGYWHANYEAEHPGLTYEPPSNFNAPGEGELMDLFGV